MNDATQNPRKPEEACAVVLRSGVVVNVLGRNESAALFRAFRVGVAQ